MPNPPRCARPSTTRGALSAPDPSTNVEGLRVLAFCDYFGASSSGGSELVAAEVYGRLVQRGVAVTVVTATPGQPAGRRTVNGVVIVTTPALNLSRLVGAQLAVGRNLGRVARSQLRASTPDVMHANGLYFHSSVVAAGLARRCKIPLVTTVHVAGVDRLPGAVGILTDAYERTVGRRILRSSARVLGVSAAVVERTLVLGVPPTAVTEVPNGVDSERFTPGPMRSSSAPVIAYVGRLIDNKGPGLLLEALGRLRRDGLEFTAVFAGDGPLRKKLEAQARALELEGNVSFLGHVGDVAPVLASSDVAVRPSYTEGMSLAVLEAMAAGCCPIVSDIPANVELIEHGANGLVFGAGDSGALAEVLRRPLTEPRLREQLGRAARESARRFTWDSATEGLAAALATVADRS